MCRDQWTSWIERIWYSMIVFLHFVYYIKNRIGVQWSSRIPNYWQRKLKLLQYFPFLSLIRLAFTFYLGNLYEDDTQQWKLSLFLRSSKMQSNSVTMPSSYEETMRERERNAWPDKSFAEKQALVSHFSGENVTWFLPRNCTRTE